MSTPLKMDRKTILKFFSELRTTQAASDFAEDLERILFFDGVFLKYVADYAKDTTPQHVFLNEILKNCNNLLTILQPLKRDGSLQHCEDLSTANLIQGYVTINY